jgi:hypothetical protein
MKGNSVMANDERDVEARRRAQAMWEKSGKKQAPEPSSEREKEQRASEAKVARLRELRLAKEAAEREAAQKAKPARRKS